MHTKLEFWEEKVYQIGTLVAGSFSLQEVLDKLTETAVTVTGVKACAIRLLDEGSDELKFASSFGLSEKYQNRGIISRQDAVIRQAFAGKAVVIDDMRDSDLVKHKQAAIEERLVSQLTVGMKFRDRVIGVLRLYRSELKPFDQLDIALARLVATQCAAAITNARLYEKAIKGAQITEQMKLAGEIQRRMIPANPPVIDGLDVAAIYKPCFEIGGDIYDFMKADDHLLVIAIADAIGKGIPAALMMSMFRGALRAYKDPDVRIDSVVHYINKLNQVACEECHNGEFITMFFAVIDTVSRKIMFCNCGHEPALLIRDRKVRELDVGGLVLGVMRQAEYQVETMDLLPGDKLLFYTDGLIDAVNFEGDQWGRDAMIEALRQCQCDSAETMIKNLLVFRRRFVGLADQADDTSVVAAVVK